MRPGDVVAARFELESLAAEGGMGAVWRARDRLGGGAVAIKLVHDGLLGARLDDRFVREASVLASLRHPAIVRYLAHGDASSVGGRRWLAMEWLDGESLQARLAGSRLGLAESVALGRRIADALAAAHALGVVHRDVKPSNVLLVGSDPNDARLLDFGIVHRARGDDDTRLTATGMALGTPGYMSPEQARGDPSIDARADVFSLGCLLFKCVTGRRAFAGDDVMAVLARVLLERAPSARALDPSVPAALDALLSQMLEGDRDRRPANAVVVGEALARIVIEPDQRRATGRTPTTPPTPTLGTHEQRVVSVVAIRLASTEEKTHATNRDGTLADATLQPNAHALPPSAVQRLRFAAASYGARIEGLADGSILAVLSDATGLASATDRVAHAARCALAMRESVTELEAVRIALATGRSVQTMRGAPLGEAIDRVAALLRLPTTAHVRIDDATAGLLGVRFEIAAASQEGLELRVERAAEETARTLLGKPTPCVGREGTIAAIEALMSECAAESVARVVLVTGPPGIGKSRVRHEILRKLSADVDRSEEGRWDVWSARGDPLHAGSAFTLVAQALRRVTGVQMGEPPAAQQRKIRARVARCVADDEVQHVSETIGEMLDAEFPDRASERLRAARANALVLGDQMRRAVQDFLDAELHAHPVLVVLDDLQWGDLPSVTLLDGALGWLRDRPLMVLAFARDEVRATFPRLWADRSVHEVKLGELGRRASEKLVRAALGADAEDSTVSRIVDRAQGNAFYLEELIRAVRAGSDDALPSTLMAMVAVRLEAVPAEGRQVLRAASVLGEVFWRGAVETLLGGSSDGSRSTHVSRWLEHLCEHEIVVRSGGAPRFPGQDEYAFRHSLVRETSYAMLTDDDRALGHRLAGAWLDRVGERDAVVVADHFEKGALPANAVPHWLRAAETALEGDDFASAIARAERSIACGATGEARAAALNVNAEAYTWCGEIAEAARCAEEARALLPEGSRAWRMATVRASQAHQRLGHTHDLVAIGESLRRALERHGDSIEVAGACASASVSLRHVGQSGLADALLEACDRVLALDRPPLFTATVHVAHAYRALEQGDPATFLDHIQAAVIDYEAAGARRSAADKRGDLAYGHAMLGGYARAERALRESLVESQRAGLVGIVALARNNLGMVLGRSGRLVEAREVEASAVEAFRAQGNLRLEGGSRIYLAEIQLLARELEDAEREAVAAVDCLDATPAFRPYALATLARVLLARGCIELALERAREARSALDALGGTAEEGEAIVLLVHAECLHAAGAFDEAKSAVVVARDRLLDRARKISSDAARDSFLRNVAEHARTIALAEEWTRSPR